jgi:hypothetical protein
MKHHRVDVLQGDEEKRRVGEEKVLIRDQVGEDERDRVRARRREKQSVWLHRKRASSPSFREALGSGEGNVTHGSEASRVKSVLTADMEFSRHLLGTHSIFGGDGALLSFSMERRYRRR